MFKLLQYRMSRWKSSSNHADAGVGDSASPLSPVLCELHRAGQLLEISTEQEILDNKLFFEDLNQAETGNGAMRERRLGVSSWLDTKIIPVRVAGQLDTLWLLVARDYLHTEELQEVARTALQKGFRLHPDFQVIVMTDPLLLAISRGSLGARRMQLRRKVDASQESSRLFDGFKEVIRWALEQGAADVDFRCSRRDERSWIGFSIAGQWVFPERYAMPSQMMRQMLGLAFQFGEGASEPSLDMGIEQQLRIYLTLPACRPSPPQPLMLRWASMAADETYCVTCRIIVLSQKLQATRIEDLGYLPSQAATLRRALHSDGGAVVLSGVVNSGKSTTISTIMGMIPATRKIVTLEDPVEFMIPGAISNTVARPLTGHGSPILAAKLRTLKRTGFNDFLLGEIRDQETGSVAQDVFESGQKLYTTVHTGRAWMIPDRLAGQSIGIPREVLATPGNLRLLANQSLLPRNCPHCKLPFSALMGGAFGRTAAHWRGYAERLLRLYDLDLASVAVRNPAGCSQCQRVDMPELNGFGGRTTAAEMIEPDEEFCRLVAQSDSVGMLRHLEALRGSTRYDDPDMTGKSSMDCAIYKVSTGEIDPREVEPRYTSFESVELSRQRRHSNRGGTLKSVVAR